MKIIDEKGRLFGKLSIIDLLVILLIVVVAVFLGKKILNNNVVANDDKPVTIEYTVKVSEVDPSTYEVIKQFVDQESGKKDQLLTGTSLCDGYVVDCVATPHVTYVENQDGTISRVVSSGDDPRLDLVFTIQATVTNTVTNAVGSQEVRAGMPQVVKTTHFEFQLGTVLTCTWLETE